MRNLSLLGRAASVISWGLQRLPRSKTLNIERKERTKKTAKLDRGFELEEKPDGSLEFSGQGAGLGIGGYIVMGLVLLIPAGMFGPILFPLIWGDAMGHLAPEESKILFHSLQ